MNLSHAGSRKAVQQEAELTALWRDVDLLEEASNPTVLHPVQSVLDRQTWGATSLGLCTGPGRRGLEQL